MYRGICIAALLAIGTAHAQEAVLIKIKPPASTNTIVLTTNEAIVSRLKLEDENGKVLHDVTNKKGKITSFTETILQRNGSNYPVRIQRTYQQCQVKDDETVEDLPIPGGIVLITGEMENPSFTFKDGKVIEGKLAEVLTREMDSYKTPQGEKDRILFPQKPVRVGDRWDLDTEAFVKQASRAQSWSQMGFDLPQCKGSGQLLKTYMKDGRLFGDFRFELVLPLLTVGKGPKLQTFEKGAKLELSTAMSLCIDGTYDARSLDATMRLNGRTIPNQGRSGSIETRSEMKSTAVEAPGK